jgi:hypothetical protein
MEWSSGSWRVIALTAALFSVKGWDQLIRNWPLELFRRGVGNENANGFSKVSCLGM